MSDVVSELDDALDESGEEVVLRRTVGTTQKVDIDVVCPANVRSIQKPDQLAAGIYQDDIRVIISPTPILAAQWPGGLQDRNPPSTVEPWLPRRGDVIIRNGRTYHVELADPIRLRKKVVRIVITAKGNAAT